MLSPHLTATDQSADARKSVYEVPLRSSKLAVIWCTQWHNTATLTGATGPCNISAGSSCDDMFWKATVHIKLLSIPCTMCDTGNKRQNSRIRRQWILCILDCASSWYLNKGRPTWWHLLYYVNLLLNMFRMLIHPSSGACDSWCVIV